MPEKRRSAWPADRRGGGASGASKTAPPDDGRMTDEKWSAPPPPRSDDVCWTAGGLGGHSAGIVRELCWTAASGAGDVFVEPSVGKSSESMSRVVLPASFGRVAGFMLLRGFCVAGNEVASVYTAASTGVQRFAYPE